MNDWREVWKWGGKLSGIKTWRAFISRPPAPCAVCQQSSYLLTYCRRKHAKAKYSSGISVYIWNTCTAGYKTNALQQNTHKTQRNPWHGTTSCSLRVFQTQENTLSCECGQRGYPESLWSHHPWRGSKPDWTQTWTTCSQWPCFTRWEGLFQLKGFWCICISTNTCSSFRRIVGSHVLPSLPTYHFLSSVWKHNRSSCRLTVCESPVNICTDYKAYCENSLK